MSFLLGLLCVLSHPFFRPLCGWHLVSASVLYDGKEGGAHAVLKILLVDDLRCGRLLGFFSDFVRPHIS